MIPPRLDFRFLKRAVSIEQLLADKERFAGLRRQGPNWVGPCPLHGGDNPNAFVVHRDRNLWRCFTACDAGGDVVELARRLADGSYPAAARDLARIAGSPAPVYRPVNTIRQRAFSPFTARLRLDPAAPFLARKGIRPQTAADYEVGAFHGQGWLTGCVALRLHDPDCRPLGYAGRRLDPEQAARSGKWAFPPGLPRNTLLYGYHRAMRPRTRGVVLVECPWGVLRLAQLGILAVALLGTHLSEPQRALLENFPRVILMLDGDRAGRLAATAILARLTTPASLVQLPDGADPDDLTDLHLRLLLPLFL